MCKKVKAVIFDMDGVLLNSEVICDRIWRRLAIEMNLADIEDAIIENRGCSSATMIKNLKKRYGESFDQKRFSDDFHKYFLQIENTSGIPLMPAVLETLEYLKTKNYRLALATSTRRVTATRQLKAVNIFDYFEITTFGDEIEHSKPAPDIYLKAVQMLNLEPCDCVSVEDSPNGVLSSFSANLKTIMIPDQIQPDEQIKKLCWKIGKNLSVLKEFL